MPVMRQTWEHVGFLHWPLPVARIRPLIPPGLAVDTWEGDAWVGVVPFAMRGVRLRGLPGFPGATNFLELNVRTYVTRAGVSGVWFFSLDAESRLAVWVARSWFHLNYVWAEMSMEVDSGGSVTYSSQRRRPADPAGGFDGRYRPTGEAVAPAPGSLEHFLAERYHLFAESRSGRLYRGQIHHEPWPLQPAECELGASSMLSANGIECPDSAPLCHYARRVDMTAEAPVRLS